MKYLTLLRHAKSSWKDQSKDDFDRPLSRRGKRDAPLLGQRLFKLGSVPDVIISSPAKRARKTAELVAVEMHFPEEAIRLEPRIYEAGADILIKLIFQLDKTWQDVMLVGHNPGLTEVSNLLAPCGFDNIVTCGVAKISFEVEAWQDIKLNSGQLLFYEYPKKLL